MNLNGKIKLFATDCDGVLTDGGMYYFDNGIVGKKFHCHDGSAFQILKENKISLSSVLYVGDDLNDGDVMKNVGFSCCPNDAVEYIKKMQIMFVIKMEVVV